MEYIYNLFTSESKQLIDSNNKDTSQDENTCMYYDYSNYTPKNTRTNLNDFSNYRYNPDRKFKIKLYEMDKEKKLVPKTVVFKTFYYEELNKKNFYIESNTTYNFRHLDGKLIFEIIDDESQIINKFSANFSVHNSVKYNEDCICIVQRTCKLYIYLIRQNNDECFYVRNIIFEKI